MKQHWLSHGWPRSPTLYGVRGRADRKGACCGAEGPASGDARTEGLGGTGLRARRALRNPGTREGARPLRERGPRALPPAVEKAKRRGATPTPERGLYLARPEVKKGFKQENVARGGVYADRAPKPTQKHFKPKRKDNWAATAASIRGRAPGARVFRSLAIPTP